MPSWQLPSVRKNLFTTVHVMDVSEGDAMMNLLMLMRLYASRMTIRIGFVFVGDPEESSSDVSPNSGDAITGAQFARLFRGMMIKYKASGARAFLAEITEKWGSMNEMYIMMASRGMVEDGSDYSVEPLSVKDVVDTYLSVAMKKSKSKAAAAPLHYH